MMSFVPVERNSAFSTADKFPFLQMGASRMIADNFESEWQIPHTIRSDAQR